MIVKLEIKDEKVFKLACEIIGAKIKETRDYGALKLATVSVRKIQDIFTLGELTKTVVPPPDPIKGEPEQLPDSKPEKVENEPLSDSQVLPEPKEKDFKTGSKTKK